MLFRNYLSAQANAANEIRFMRILLAGLVVVLLVVALILLKLAGSEKTYLVPPEIKRSYWLSGETVSREYLEDMAYWYAGLALNITPTVSAYQSGLFLKHADPAEFGRLQMEMGARAEFLKKNNTSTQFSVRSVTPDEKALRVALTGVLTTWASDKKAGERQATFLVGFKHLNGRLHVAEFKETSEQNPFDSAPAR